MNIKLRTGLGIVIVYTAYSTYVQLRTSYDISERARKKLYESDLQAAQKAEWPSTKFSSMMVAGRYVNPFTQYRAQTVFEFVYCRISELFHAKPRAGVPSDPAVLKKLLPVCEPDFELLYQNTKDYVLGGKSSALSLPSLSMAADGERTPSLIPSIKERMTLTWLGQSCAFVQVPGINILTDPCFGSHLLSQYVGPRRLVDSPCQIEDLPSIDLVLVSHDHPDHLELESCSKVEKNTSWVVPIGVGKHLKKAGIPQANVTELDWWQKVPVPNTKPEDGWEIACTPAMHWSGRTMIDSNTTLWCSFLVLRHGKPIFFHAGDTGYSPDLFQGIKRVFGAGCQLAMVPCGAYRPRWHLRPQHTDPYEALQIMKDLEAHKLVGVHWGTFILSDEHFLEPRDKLHELAKKGHVENDVIAPQFGKTLVFRMDNDSSVPSRKMDVRDGYSLLMD
jgi:N-acyl-phosphatidylethanolamine-hydrolysing phospholipase D